MEKNNNTLIYWTMLEHREWNLYMAATPKGLCYVGSQNKPYAELVDWAKTRLPHGTLVRDDEKMESYVTELREYLTGERKGFSIPFDFRGTPFQTAVWNALCQIPYGETKTYSAIAEHIQKPAAVRAVGTAIGANPILITIPCHRVIGKDGSLTGYRGGLEMKTKLLTLEKEGAVVERSSLHA